jgi:hypothetical protein
VPSVVVYLNIPCFPAPVEELLPKDLKTNVLEGCVNQPSSAGHHTVVSHRLQGVNPPIVSSTTIVGKLLRGESQSMLRALVGVEQMG